MKEVNINSGKIKKDSAADKEKINRAVVFTEIAKVSGVGLSVSFPIVGGAIFGSYLDNIYNSRPLITLTLIIFGTIIGFMVFFKIILDYIKNKI